jgi:hypothetical protein
VTEVSGEGVEVAAQSVGGDGGDAVLVKTMLEVMDESKGVVLRASAEMQGGDGFADRVEGEPKPRGTGSLTNTCIKFIHLDEGQDEVAEQQIVPALAVTAHALEPAGEGSIGMTGEADKDGDIDPLSKKPEDKLNLFGIGLEVIKWGVDPTGEDFVTGLALEALNAVVHTVADQRMDRGVCNAIIVAVGMRTREPMSGHRFLATTTALALPVGTNVGVGAQQVEAQTGLAVKAVMR